MFYRISNIASKSILERHLQIKLKYPHLYERKIMINGLEESIIPVVTMDESEAINYSIWGILPQGYQEDWSVFQDICNTLNVPLSSIDANLWYAKSLVNRRCLIPITGFFTSYLFDGEVYPYLYYRENALPFCLAGIYNILDDGFVTSSIVTCKADKLVSRVHNLGQEMPLIVHQDLHSSWLDQRSDSIEIKTIINTAHEYQIKSHPIAKQFYKNNIAYNSMLDPVYYDNIPNGIS